MRAIPIRLSRLFLVSLLCLARAALPVHEAAAAGPPSASQVPLDPLTIPKFAHPLTIPRVFAPTVVTRGDRVIRHEYTVTAARIEAQLLPPGFPTTTVLAFGGQVRVPGSSATEFVRSVPGPVFENVRGIPSLVRWRNAIDAPYFMPVDPTLHWANPLAMERPVFPFAPFPPGYPTAQAVVPLVVHTHGLVVGPAEDGTAEQWFTPPPSIVGPAFVTRDYLMPNEQPSTALFYHDHTMGMTRLNVFSGLVGPAYLIRDPHDALDAPGSPLPRGEFEIPLAIFDRAFFTDGELSFPRTSSNPTATAYWQPGDGANTVLVNGKVWPNLDVQRRQYRFRLLAAGNGRLWNFQFENQADASIVPFTVIGSDGGYLPAPQVVSNVVLGITERSDVLFDFSQFAPGTQIVLVNAGANRNTVGTVMRFTVLDGPAVPPPPLPAFPPRPALVPDAPRRIKSFHNHVDLAGNAMRSTDGLTFTSPPTEFPLVGSTEQWDVVNVGGGAHQIHLHLIEFQVLDRQPINAAAYNLRWQLLNGFRPITRPITVDPAPYLTGPAVPPDPWESGWKDTVRAPAGFVTRIVTRWAPQDIAGGAVAPGENRFPIDPTASLPQDPFTQQGYVWHCHILGHEDHDMMRPMPLVRLWAPRVGYPVGRVVTHQDVNYRARVAHRSAAGQPPSARPDRWERVNNNDGTWQPQIIYAVGDRVLFEGQLYAALSVHQAAPGQTPASAPALWRLLPATACGQLADFCTAHADAEPGAVCLALGQAGNEAACTAQFSACLPACSHLHAHGVAHPCAGLCNAAVAFTVPDGTVYKSGALGTGSTCHETFSKVFAGRCSGFVGARTLTVNGRVQACDRGTWTSPLPPQRNDGYCIQVSAGGPPWASFATW